MAILLSFTYFNMLQPPQWIGLHNYIRLFLEDDIFLIAVKNTLVYATITGPRQLSVVLCNSLVDQRTQAKGEGVSDPVILCPVHLRKCLYDLADNL